VVDCYLNGVSVGLLLDMGHKVSNTLTFNPPLQPQTIELRIRWKPYSLPRLRDLVISDFRFYVTEHGMSILCVDLFDSFGGTLLLIDR